MPGGNTCVATDGGWPESPRRLQAALFGGKLSLIFPMWRGKIAALLMAGARQCTEGKEEVAADGGKPGKFKWEIF